MVCRCGNSFEFRGKNCTSTSAWMLFFNEMKTNVHIDKTGFALITHLLSIRTSTSWINVDECQYREHALTGSWLGVASRGLGQKKQVHYQTKTIHTRVMYMFMMHRTSWCFCDLHEPTFTILQTCEICRHVADRKYSCGRKEQCYRDQHF